MANLAKFFVWLAFIWSLFVEHSAERQPSVFWTSEQVLKFFYACSTVYIFFFLLSQDVDVNTEQEQLHQLKQKVIKMLVGAADKPSQMLNLIDGIQRLGVSYHFETEIEAALKHIYESDRHFDDLYTVALFFRLLRQQGFPVSCGN